jgi:polyhydroxybutyrate depolymerase
MSMGGFMTYVLACHFPNMLAAIAPVAGNMVVTTQANCPMEKGIPLLEIHGTNDYIVAYKGTFFITPVTKTVAWWAKQSGCDSLLKDTDLPNFNTEDKCEIKKTVYLNPKNKVEVVHYCIKGGGHTWPGAPAIKILGKTCYDMNASAVIWSFFSKYCSSKATSIKK